MPRTAQKTKTRAGTKTKKARSKASAGKVKFSEQAQENARNVFLAGVGAYDKAFEEAQCQFKDAQHQLKENRSKAEDLFSQLIKRGEAVESKAKKRIKQIDLAELKLPVQDQLRDRLDRARGSFDTLRKAIASKQA